MIIINIFLLTLIDEIESSNEKHGKLFEISPRWCVIVLDTLYVWVFELYVSWTVDWKKLPYWEAATFCRLNCIRFFDGATWKVKSLPPNEHFWKIYKGLLTNVVKSYHNTDAIKYTISFSIKTVLVWRSRHSAS